MTCGPLIRPRHSVRPCDSGLSIRPNTLSTRACLRAPEIKIVLAAATDRHAATDRRNPGAHRAWMDALAPSRPLRRKRDELHAPELLVADYELYASAIKLPPPASTAG